MLGTPAYMAPEQFAGRATGPATDQFAYAVALWEALAGSRPFLGDTLEELRRAVEAGVPRSDAAISRGLRRVIQRGLARDPAARWPSLDALLAAFDRARVRPRRIAMIAAALVLAGACVAVYVATRPGATEAAAACPPPEQLMFDAAPPSLRALLEQRFAAQPGWAHISGQIDQFTNDWIDVYRGACKEPAAPEFHSRLACLDGALDEFASLLDNGRVAPPAAIGHFDLREAIAPPKGCTDGTRVGYPAMSPDPDVRAQVSALRRQIAFARTSAEIDGDRAKSASQTAVDAARELPYRAILAEALVAQGDVLEITGDLAGA